MVWLLLEKIWSWRHQFIKYFIIGISGVLLDMILLWLFKEYGKFRPVEAVALTQIFVLSYNFSLNKYWTFKNKGLSHKQMMRYLFTAGANYVFSIVFMWVFNEYFGFNYLIVRLGSIAVMVSWNFILYRFWIFKNKPDTIPIA